MLPRIRAEHAQALADCRAALARAGELGGIWAGLHRAAAARALNRAAFARSIARFDSSSRAATAGAARPFRGEWPHTKQRRLARAPHAPVRPPIEDVVRRLAQRGTKAEEPAA